MAALLARDGQPSLCRLRQIVIDELHYLGLPDVRTLAFGRALNHLFLCLALNFFLRVGCIVDI